MKRRVDRLRRRLDRPRAAGPVGDTGRQEPAPADASIDAELQRALANPDSLRTAVWEFMRPMLSPALVERNRDAFVVRGRAETTVDLDGHRAPSDLDELALDDEHGAEVA